MSTERQVFDTTRWLYEEATGLLTNKLYADGPGPSYTYTPEGKLATRACARGVTTTYGYDAADNLSSISHSNPSTPSTERSGSTPFQQLAYAYDHRGRMVRKEISRRDAETQSSFYTWDGWNIIRETRVSRLASRVTHNVWGLDLDGTRQGASGLLAFELRDRLARFRKQPPGRESF